MFFYWLTNLVGSLTLHFLTQLFRVRRCVWKGCNSILQPHPASNYIQVIKHDRVFCYRKKIHTTLVWHYLTQTEITVSISKWIIGWKQQNLKFDTVMACCMIFLTVMQPRSAESSCTQVGAYKGSSFSVLTKKYLGIPVMQCIKPLPHMRHFGGVFFSALFTVTFINPYSLNVLAYFGLCFLVFYCSTESVIQCCQRISRGIWTNTFVHFYFWTPMLL